MKEHNQNETDDGAGYETTSCWRDFCCGHSGLWLDDFDVDIHSPRL